VQESVGYWMDADTNEIIEAEEEPESHFSQIGLGNH
jgi:hypothetical protein